MKTNDIKKGMEIKTDQLGVLISGTMEDNKKGNTRLIDTKGSEVGMFDEMGSVYAWNIKLVKVDDAWEKVELTDKQVNDQKRIRSMGW